MQKKLLQNLLPLNVLPPNRNNNETSRVFYNISIVYYKNGTFIETTIGQLNFFKWALENCVVKYIDENYDTIEKDMNNRNSTSKRKETIVDNSKTRKKREELSISATKSIKKEKVEIVVQFN